MIRIVHQKKPFRNNMSCKSFANFVRKTLLNRLTTGAISLLGKVGDVQAPHIVLPLTVEPSKPRLCHDARYLTSGCEKNLSPWIALMIYHGTSRKIRIRLR